MLFPATELRFGVSVRRRDNLRPSEGRLATSGDSELEGVLRYERPMRTATVRVAVVSAVMFAAICGCGGRKHASAEVQSAPPLVIYLHGMFDVKTPDQATSDRFRERFRNAGFDVWAPTGRPGLCDWSEEAKHSVCWPSDERALAAAREIVHEWGPQVPTRRPVIVAGFSNGGAFTVLLAVHGLVSACGFASMHGFPAGTLHAESGKPAPILLIGGSGAAWESGLMTTATTQLRALGWPHEARMHDGGHAVSDKDLDDVLAFAQRAVRNCSGHPNVSASSATPE